MVFNLLISNLAGRQPATAQTGAVPLAIGAGCLGCPLLPPARPLMVLLLLLAMGKPALSVLVPREAAVNCSKCSGSRGVQSYTADPKKHLT